MKTRATLFIFVLVAGTSLVSCLREKRDFPQTSSLSQSVAVTELHPGGASPPTPPQIADEHNAYSLSEAKTLFSAYNCTGCHANGGGAIGPPLMDDEWIYGHEVDQIYRTILEGRPNGMPAFRQKIPDRQIWQLAAYVRSMSGLTPKDASPSRDDHMSGKLPESRTPELHPTNSSVPPSAVQ